jgi:two-component system sensor histidine kinase BaeS
LDTGFPVNNRKKMASIKRRIVFSFGISLAIFLIFVSVIIFYGLNAALKGWNRASEERYALSIAKVIEKLFEENYSRKKEPENKEIIKAVEQYLGERFSTILALPSGEIILSHNVKREMPQFIKIQRPNKHHENRTGANAERNSRFFPPPMKQVIIGGETKVYIWTKSVYFSTDDEINKKPIQSIFITLLLGIISSFTAAMIFTSFISSKIKKEVAALSKGLKAMAAGSRDVFFAESSLNEISSIGRNALVLQKQLTAEEKARKQWTQDIAHDLRTPITAIRAQIEAMVDGIFKPNTERFKKLLAEVNRLEILIEDINRLTILESPDSPDKNNRSFSEVSSQYFADLLKERFDIFAKEKRIELVFNVGLFKIKCDISHIARALSNILQNSIQYSRENTAINIRFYTENNFAVIETENSGEIPEDEIPKIFQRLYRGEFGRSAPGSGLGLTIAKAAVEKHGGKIDVYNTKQHGAKRVCFKVMLPLLQAEEPDTQG